MIIGIILRNFKTYNGINYIPLSNGEKFCGLIGQNGIGKSSILEALDCFFNNKDWNQNIDSNKSGIDISYITPIFLIEKTKLKINNDLAEKLSNEIWNFVTDTTTHTIRKKIIDKINISISQIKPEYTKENYFLLPLGENIDRDFTINVYSSILQSLHEKIEGEDDDVYQNKVRELFKPLMSEVKDLYDYIYIPKDIEPNNLVQLETKEIQRLMGEKLEDVIGAILPRTKIGDISTGLKAFIDELSGKLVGYKFKVPSSNQPNLKPVKIYSLIIEEFFSLRELHKEVDGGKDLPLRQLSSGEKQQAILSLVHSIIHSYRVDSSNIILAVDEPEASLHISACFDQFEKLYNVSNLCGQVIFSSHWYGFIPAMNSGIITNIAKKDNAHEPLLFNISKYREEIKHNAADYQQTHHHDLPMDIMLKSNNDFIQSIISSIIKEEPYNWLICEGSSDKIYFDEYFKDEIEFKKLRIIPVGNAKEVKKTYNHLKVSFEELGTKINGKVILITDTDTNLLEFDTSTVRNLICKRIVNDIGSKTTKLVEIKSNPKNPKTDIEDVLNGKLFHKTLLEFKNDYFDLLTFINDEDVVKETPSYIALDLKPTDYQLLDRFFNTNDNKFDFSKAYIKNLKEGTYEIPNWISEIKSYFN